VLAFGATALLKQPATAEAIRAAFPAAILFGCSTSGEISGTTVTDNTLIATAIQFEHTDLRFASTALSESAGSFAAGATLGRSLPPSVPAPNGKDHLPLTHVLVLSDGLKVNGSDLVRGLAEQLPASTTLTGGLAGDGARFKETLVFAEGRPQPNTISVLGLYSSRLKVSFGSRGGWDPFGPERLITRSTGNVLYEFDGRSALDLYKQYLGVHASGLPATGLLFPISVRARPGETPVVRTILATDDSEQSMTFAGDVPKGAYARLMKANSDRLIDGATGAAQICAKGAAAPPQMALLISCVGRKLVLKQRVEEEVEGVSETLGQNTLLAGFYSYGEISPFSSGARCELHNQTMTITTFSEA
jgi:hypothetical protein